MGIRTDDALLKAANKAMRITVVIYVLIKQITYNLMFESTYWIPRACAGAVMLAIAFGVTRIRQLPKRHISWVVPLLLAVTETILVASFGGDRLIYIFLIGCALLSLLYMDTAGLLITVSVSCTVAAICLFAWGRTLIGEAYDIFDDIFNFMGLIVVDVLVFLIGKYGIGTLTKSKQAVEAALRDAQDANRAKTNFLATMSHEIRTPLNAILGVAQLQLCEEDLPERYAQSAGRIIDSGNTLLGIINDILDMSKIESGSMELLPDEFYVPGLINDAVQLNIVRLGSKPIEFIPEIDPELPSVLCGDELRLKQILNNLLSNAIKYTEKGQVKLTVGFDAMLSSTETEPRRCNIKPVFTKGDRIAVIFKIEDTGQGIKPEDCEKVFSTEYTRFNAEANRTTEGTGLGLGITKSLVALMDGEITVKSVYGKGSVFTVTVMLRVVNPEPIGTEITDKLHDFSYIDDRARERSEIVRSPMPYGKVLVVDDVESNLYVIEGLLSQYKLNTETVSSGFKALEKIEGGNVYDVIFMDHMMPRMDGIETTQKLRGLGYGGTVIALTANALVGNEEMFRENGFDGFVPKPVDTKLLDTVLNKFIRDRHPEEAAKHKPQTTADDAAGKIDTSKLLRAFERDADTALTALRESVAGGDIKVLTTAAHSMKSALANIGEKELSGKAAALERAGADNDRGFIDANAEGFIGALENLIGKLRGMAEDAAGTGKQDADMAENKELLSQQLGIVITACENYDDTGAFAALARLREESGWKKETADTIERIHDALFASSDFDEAARLAGELQKV